jgi:hypothetical protein
MTETRTRAPLASVALVSFAALGSEIVLNRVFAVVHWHHFAFMIISLALLGFGASGTFLAVARRRLLSRYAASYLASIASFGVLVIASPLAALSLPFRAEALLWDPWQPLWLVLMYLVLAAPFFCAANAIGLALMSGREYAGRVYAADLAGAGIGSVAVLGLMYWIWPEGLLRVVAAAAFVAVIVGAVELNATPLRWTALAVAGMTLLALLPSSWLRLEPGPYKALSQALRVGGTQVLLERSSPLARISVIESSRMPLRLAPGLSLNATAEPPEQLGMFTDGDAIQAITARTDDPARLEYLSRTTSALAYAIAAPRSVLVAEAGGGDEILRARRLGAQRIDALELNPQVIRLLRETFREYTGNLAGLRGVQLLTGEARGFLQRSGQTYDLIQLSLGGAGSGGGLGGLNENYQYTVEALRLYLRHLEPDGFLAITAGVQIPPREGLKLAATAIRAMQLEGIHGASDRLIMVRGWQTSTMLLKNGDVTADEIADTRAFCDAQSFDPVWYRGLERRDTNQRNQLPEPWYFDGIAALLGDSAERYLDDYPYQIRPATDDRPYFQNFFRWRTLSESWRARERGGMALFEAGYLLLALTLAQALIAGVVLILAPLRLLAPPQGLHRARRLRVVLYFGGIGLAFMFLEIAFLQKLLLVVHHPTVALGLTLGTFLVAAGAGSLWADRTPSTRARRTLGLATTGILLLGTLHAFAFDAITALLAAWPGPASAAAAACLVAPLAFCMGMPFPLALRELDAPLVPWAWGINGCASVVSAALATLLAVDLGLRNLLWLALALYALVPLAFPSRAAENPRSGSRAPWIPWKSSR